MADKVKRHILLKTLIAIVIIFILLLSSVFVYYQLTKQDIRKYVPNNFIGLLKIDSLSKTYQNLINLKASDVILSKDEYQSVFKIVQDIRSSKLAKNKLLLNILDLQCHIIVDKNYSLGFIFDIGFKSILLRSSSFITNFIGKNDDFSLEQIKDNNKIIYKIILFKKNQVFFVSIKNNLLFFSFKKEIIDNIYSANKENRTLFDDNNFYYIKNQIRKGGIAEIYFNTQEVINALSKNFDNLSNITDMFKFEENSGISANISNENISLNSFTKIFTDDKLMKDFIDNAPLDMKVTKYLPEDTNIYTDINFKSFEEFYKVFIYLQDGKFDDTIEKINNAAKLFFGGDINDLLFSWIGNEAGVFTSQSSNSPVIFLSIANKNKMNKAFENIYSSNLIEHETNILYEGVKLDKTKLPDFLLWIINSFYKGFDTPYYVIQDDFIFFCMEPDPLSNLINKFNSGKTLIYDNQYKKIVSEIENKANIFLFFNLSNSFPKFLNNNTIISQILKLYEKGVLSINFNNQSLRLDLSATGINEKKARLFPGYPKFVKEGISSPIVLKDITGSQVSELLYIRRDQNLVISDINNNPIAGFPVKIDGESDSPPFSIDINSSKSIVCVTKNNIIHRFDISGIEYPPYPVKIEIKSTFYPVLYKDELIFFDKDQKKMFFYDINNSFQEYNFEFKSLLLSPPAMLNDYFVFYPKNFSGTIYITNKEGICVSDWPKDAGSIAFGTPIIKDINNNGSKEIIFITQNGNLNVWKENSDNYNDFPLKVDGVFYNQGGVGDVAGDKNKEIVLLDKEGNLLVISDKKEILGKIKIKDTDEKETKIMLFDVNKDKRDEILIYGGGNNIYCFDDKLSVLPGFPVKGSFQPDFTDFDSDGQYEMVSGSFDKNIYVYTIPKN